MRNTPQNQSYDELEDPQELADEVPPYHTVNVSEFLKSAGRLNRSLSTAYSEKSRSDGLHSRLSNHRSKQSFDDTENLDLNDPTSRLKMQLHESHKREASQRLQISRLRSCVDQLNKESQKLRQDLLQA